MTILGVSLRTRPEDRAAVVDRLHGRPGVDVALDPGDGRLVLVIEDAVDADGGAVTAAATLGAIALWPDVVNTLLVYEYSGPDSPAPEVDDYRAWRSSLGAASGRSPAGSA